MNLESLIGRAQSVSYVPKDADTTQRLVSGLKALCDSREGSALRNLWADEQGRVCLGYTTQVFLADKSS